MTSHTYKISHLQILSKECNLPRVLEFFFSPSKHIKRNIFNNIIIFFKEETKYFLKQTQKLDHFVVVTWISFKNVYQLSHFKSSQLYIAVNFEQTRKCPNQLNCWYLERISCRNPSTTFNCCFIYLSKKSQISLILGFVDCLVLV